MTAFDNMLDVLFGDPNLSLPARYFGPGEETPVPCRIIKAAPDREATLGETRAVVVTTNIEVRASEISDVAKDGEFEILDSAGAPVSKFRVVARPQRSDDNRLIWQCPAVELAS